MGIDLFCRLVMLYNNSKKVVSLFFQGTGLHRVYNQDVITSFYDATVEAGIPARLFDGVGSHPGVLADEHPTPGLYIYKSGKKVRANSAILRGVNDLVKRLSGFLAGEGMDELLFEAIVYLEDLIAENKGLMPETINLHGFSRGADACLRLANLLDSLYPDVKVNLFLIDQVPGPGRRDDPPSYTVPANVQRFESTIMLHDYKPGFDPQDKTSYVFASPSTTTASFKVFAGDHGRGIYFSEDKTTDEVPKLVHDDLFRFAKETGSLPRDAETPPPHKLLLNNKKYEDRPATVLSPQERFEHYVVMQKNWWFYSKGTVLNRRNVLSNHMQYTQDNRLFVNQEHGELFQKLYPALYKWFMQGNTQPTVSEAAVIKELQQLSELDTFYKNLCKVFHIEEGKPLPKSSFLDQPFLPPLGKPLVSDELSYLHHALMSVVNYAIHHQKENSADINIAINTLQNALSQTINIGDPQSAIQYLREKIEKTALSLGKKNRNSYLYQQLMKLSVRPNEFIDSAIELFSQTWLLHEAQKTYLEKVCLELQAIKENDELNSLEKFVQAKKIVGIVSQYLEKPMIDAEITDQLEENIVAHNIFENAKYLFDTQALTPAKLLKSVNLLITPIIGETSIAADIAKRFDAYYKRNMFWNTINTILSTVIKVTLPPFVSPKKSALAEQISSELKILDDKGLGSNLKEISKVLSKGQDELQKFYRKDKPILGEFDKILNSSQARVRAEFIDISEFSRPSPVNSM